MKRKAILTLVGLALASFLLASCSPAATPVVTDAVASASIVDTASAFEKAISSEGTWTIATTKDLAIDKDLVLEGDFKNGKKDADGKELYQRKIGLYTQDADFKITQRFTLTAKSLTVTSIFASIQHGTFKGDLYVAVDGFALIDAKIEGNVYFKDESAKSTFTMDATSSITGVQEIRTK